MDWKSPWINKAKEHLEAGLILYEQGLYRDSLARLYYSAYSLMMAECGEPSKGRWSHKGIVKCFFRRLYENSILIEKEDRERLRDFYEKRRIADYEIEPIEKEEVELYINLVEKLMEVVENA